jgi:hypothetical protein
MDTVIHGHKEQTSRGLGNVCVPAVNQNRNVMVPVQEDKWFLMDDDEECINQLTFQRASETTRNSDKHTTQTNIEHLRELAQTE